ncbi:MAG: hypothetical protein IGR76_07825 [Synechococcales cyanobacterium T60_A2020_003]|nr:hypothetical protein [Synechococcales cyanobacterium T60_A2020_003]
MARYTSLFTIAIQSDSFPGLLAELLESCNLRVVYDTGDYLMARELPGEVSYAQLVTVEILIDKLPEALDAPITMNFVVKNEELPLKRDNHCRRMFNLVNQAIMENHRWHLMESVAS